VWNSQACHARIAQQADHFGWDLRPLGRFIRDPLAHIHGMAAFFASNR
jgi:hypothetical protein